MKTPAYPSAQKPTVTGKSGNWCAWLITTQFGQFGLTFDNLITNASHASLYATPRERMAALQAMALAADTPTVAVSSANDAPLHPRNFVPADGAHIIDDAFEAWTYERGSMFCFVMYIGKSAKSWKHYNYRTAEKRDAGLKYYADDARAIAERKAKRKAENKAQAAKPHGLQVGDVVRSSWGYDQTNVDHYQIVKVIGKRTVEVRKLTENNESDNGNWTGRLSPVHGDFVGEVMRRQVDSYGAVNIRSATYGRAYKIEPLAVVHGVRCYPASAYSSYA